MAPGCASCPSRRGATERLRPRLRAGGFGTRELVEDMISSRGLQRRRASPADLGLHRLAPARCGGRPKTCGRPRIRTRTSNCAHSAAKSWMSASSMRAHHHRAGRQSVDRPRPAPLVNGSPASPPPSASGRRWITPMGTHDPHAAADARVAAYWASFLGCTPEQLETSGTWVGQHAGLDDYQGVYLLRRGESCVVSAPAPLLATVTARLAGLPAASSFDVSRMRHLFGDAIERIVGPAWQGYLRADDFRPAVRPNVRQLTVTDDPALRRLAEACQRAGVGANWDWQGRAGSFRRFHWGSTRRGGYGRAARRNPAAHRHHHPSRLSRPGSRSQRGERHRRVWACGSAWYRAIRRWRRTAPSVAIARALGFSQYAATLAVRPLAAGCLVARRAGLNW